MGADIHLWVETRKNGAWEFANNYEIDTSTGEPYIYWFDPYKDRNYALFALLAGVRNLQYQLQPILPVRGVPADVSEIGRRIVKEVEGHGHTHSWASGTELLKHPWHDRIPMSGFVTPDAAIAWQNRGIAPSEWAWSKCDEYTMRLTWTSEKFELCRSFVTEFLPTLPNYGPIDETRVCFFFDN